MRIFVISHGYPTPRSPQWGCFERDQAEALAALGHEVVMLSYDGRFRLYWRKIGVTRRCVNGVTSLDIFVIPTQFFGPINSPLRRKFPLWQLDYVYKLAVKEFGKPDILYSHFLNLSQKAVYLKQKYHVPLVGIEHWSEINKPMLLGFVKEMGDSTYPYLDGLISVSNSLHDALLKHFNADSVVVHNLITDDFCYQPSKKSDKVVRYVATGSLIHRKGFDLLIKAFANANLPAEGWTLTIIGEGEEHKMLNSLIAQHNLQNNIQLVGNKTKQEIVRILQGCDIFVLPSRNENFSVAVLEALACGLPVIASICGGIRECINDTNGLLFPVDDMETLSKMLCDMFENHDRYDRKAIADDCKQHYGSKVIAKQLTQIFEKVLNGTTFTK